MKPLQRPALFLLVNTKPFSISVFWYVCFTYFAYFLPHKNFSSIILLFPLHPVNPLQPFSPLIVAIYRLSTIIQHVTVVFVRSFITHSLHTLIYSHHPVDCISTVSRHPSTHTTSLQAPYSDSSSVSVSSAAAPAWQVSRWYLNTSCVVIAWQMSHLANRPQNSSSDKPGFLIRPILSNFFHLVCLGIITEFRSVR